jgi:CRP-like cAMP-binding protein
MPAQIPPRLFAGLAPEDIRLIARLGTERKLPAGKTIHSQGIQAQEFFLLLRGRARYFVTTHDGQKCNLAWLPPGEALGGRALLAPLSKYLVSAETVRDCTLLVWKRDTIRDLAFRYPILVMNALSIASDYLDWYVATHMALVSKSARERLASVLAQLAPVMGREVADGVEIDVTNEELASAANVTPFTASRLLNEWQREQVLIKRRGKVVLRSPQKLFLRSA